MSVNKSIDNVENYYKKDPYYDKVINLDTNYEIKYVKREEPKFIVNDKKLIIPWYINSKVYESFQEKIIIKNDTPLVKIAATVDPNIETVQSILKLYECGAKILRIVLINNSWTNNKHMLKKIGKATKLYRTITNDKNFQPTIIHEISGRYTKTGRLKSNNPIRLYREDTIVLTTNRRFAYSGTNCCLYVNCADSILNAEIGEEIILDVEIFLEIVAITNTEIECNVTQGGLLRSNAWCTMPRNNLNELSSDEIEDLDFAAENEADFIIVPMFYLEEHYKLISDYLESSHGFKLPLLCSVSIDDPFCILAYKPLIKTYDGLWIGSRKSFITTTLEVDLIDHCIKQNKILIMNIPVGAVCPCQGEISKRSDQFFKDNLCRGDCVMILRCKLNLNLPKNTKELINNCQFFKSDNMYQSSNKAVHLLIETKRNRLKNADALATNAVIISFLFDAGAIVVHTRSGLSAVEIAKKRPLCHIIAVITSNYIYRRLQLRRGIFPILYEKPQDEDILPWDQELEKRLSYGIEYAKKNNFMENKSNIVCCFNAMKDSGHNNTIRLINIYDDDDDDDKL